MQVHDLLTDAVEASRTLQAVSGETTATILENVAQTLLENTPLILEANAKDLAAMSPDDPKFDRLKLTPERIAGIAADMRSVASLPYPVGNVLSNELRPNGMSVRKVSVPFGVIGIIYEARPNVTCDVFALCLRSGNACVLKGGSDAYYSNMALVTIIRWILAKYWVNPAVCTLLPADRASATALLNASGLVDLIIPRGSSELISFVRSNSKIPVIETGAGICHTYFDKGADRDKGRAIIHNAKTRRVSVCNALDCLLVHRERLEDLPYICADLAESQVVIYADNAAYEALEGHYPSSLLQHALPESYGTEFLDYKMSLRTVADINEAIAHISRYGSRHSECIISESLDMIRLFEQAIDAACVYANVSTAFTDGAQFGMGSEIGISTQKLHARGPMSLNELVTYKYIIEGSGQVRPS
ncbi:MAG: glutamate-5-semialdehyde dehydrogenase [Tannerellaceae bacterium]|jgi:glutamate-5-semialdehyde dehydrogenase|nr:glutamate-5-semialdehyde dehydrogenase [Tannerellaceae bacterium]